MTTTLQTPKTKDDFSIPLRISGGSLFERLARWLASRGRYRMIWRDEDRQQASGEEIKREPYLERFYILSTPWLGVYIHRFWASDPDGLHDHPWASISYVLKGGYMERIAGRLDIPERTAGSLYFRSAEESHRIALRDGDEPGSCWTLFIRFRRKRLWGFYRGADWIAAEKQTRSSD